MTMPKRLVILLAGGAACVLTCGCAPPLPVIPATPKKVGYGGEVRSVDLAFLRSGSATRQEVQAQLGWSDVGLNRPSVFWGRWRSSSFLDLNRWGDQRILWRGHNVLVEFDESSRVKRFQEFADKDLVGAVNGWLSAARPNSAEKRLPQEVVVRLRGKDRRGETRLVLGEESINFEGKLNVPLPNVSHVTCTGTGASPSEVRLTLQAERPSAAEKELVFDMEIPDVMSLLEFLRLKRPSALR
jgi:hypothetical protein